jgi:hypothetical protein
VQVITVADRESDFFEFLTQATEQRARFLIRARTDRMLVPEESEGFESILDAYASATVLGSLTVKIPGNGKRKARTAQVQGRVAPVTIKAPQRRGAAGPASHRGVLRSGDRSTARSGASRLAARKIPELA